MNQTTSKKLEGVRLLVVSLILFPLIDCIGSSFIQPLRLFGSLGVIYYTYIVTAIYFSVFSAISMVRYVLSYWVIVVYGLCLLAWCGFIHRLVLANAASC
jgi:hypothetical protein